MQYEQRDNFVKILKGRNSKHVFQINDVLK